MKTVCSWCDKRIDAGSDADEDDGLVSHGLCGKCADEYLAKELGVPLKNFLENIDAPILLIQKDRKIMTCNSLACKLLDKTISQVNGQLAGNVIECKHAKSEGGCGGTIHCKGCAIRLTVMETFKTGKSFTGVKACSYLCHNKEEKKARFEISTEKIGNVVVLRIDDMDTDT